MTPLIYSSYSDPFDFYSDPFDSSQPTLGSYRFTKMTKILTALIFTVYSFQAVAAESPNILIIVADDLGYSDIGAFGGEIDTPNLDSLVASGMQMTTFYSGSSCAPTRSMLMSGTDHHLAGVGVQGRRIPGNSGYENALNHRVVSLATILKDNDYHTYMTGKWHLGSEPDRIPAARGFEKSFTLMEGGASHFEDGLGLTSEQATYMDDVNKVDALPEGFFSSEFYTDRMIDYIENSSGDGKPFFGYLAYTAPHWPLQAPDTWLEKYAGKYDAGWDVLMEQRKQRQIKLGFYSDESKVADRPTYIPAWEDLSDIEKQVEAKRMETYAAMVDNLDFHIGRLMEYLRDSDELENTFILFFADNGAEGNNMGVMGNNPVWLPARFDNRLANMGKIDSYVWQGQGWAHVSALPYRMYKTYTSEGGIHVPAFFSWPGHIPQGAVNDHPVTVMDVLPTVLDVAGIAPVGNEYAGRDVLEPLGSSLVPVLTDNRVLDRQEFAWESYGNRGYRIGNWKLVWLWPPYGPGRWELFDLSVDPGETNDLSEQNPELVNTMSAAWDQWARDLAVEVWDRDIGYGR